ncbi:MAG: sulfatase/phosphatase domain-containing protein, partial [Gemmataceae bacterium]
KWESITVPEPATFHDDYQGRSGAASEATMRVDRDLTPSDLKLQPPGNLSPGERKKWNYQRYMRDYLACVDSIDENVGRLLDYLDQEKLTDNTVVIYTSDQGFFLGEHNWYDKRFMYEESLRMPFLVRWPKSIKPGSRCDSMVVNVDFAPTFLEMAGRSAPRDIQGRSIVPLLRGESPADWRTAIYYRYYHYPHHHQVQPHYGIRTDRHKLIYFNKLDQWEFYDLKTDPGEMNNLYGIDQHAKTVEELKEKLARLKQQLGDTDQYADRIPKDDVDTGTSPAKKKP